MALSNDAGHFKGSLGSCYGRAGMHDKAKGVLEELHSRREFQHVSPLWLSWIHLRLGEKGQGLDLLAQAVAQRCPYAHSVPQDRNWEPLWSDPRFCELASKVGSGVVSQAWEREGTAGPEVVPTNP